MIGFEGQVSASFKNPLWRRKFDDFKLFGSLHQTYANTVNLGHSDYREGHEYL
jgi:hypothetical protein